MLYSELVQANHKACWIACDSLSETLTVWLQKGVQITIYNFMTRRADGEISRGGPSVISR